MGKIRKIQDLGYCRSCINKSLGLHLDKNDVLVYVYPEKCERCGRVKQIVYSVKFTSRWKLALK